MATARRSAAKSVTTTLARAKRLACSESPRPDPATPIIVLTIRPKPQLIALVSSRACGSLMPAIPSQETMINATHNAISNQRGTKRLIVGTKVAATSPAQSAMENCTPSDVPTPNKRARRHKYWIARTEASRVVVSGKDADPLSVQASFWGCDGSTSDCRGDHFRARDKGRSLGTALDCHRLGNG